jgi:hypothetical protein
VGRKTEQHDDSSLREPAELGSLIWRSRIVRTKAFNISLSTTLLLVSIAFAWLLALSSGITDTGIMEPPGRGPWYSYSMILLPLLCLPTVPWVAARFWYWPPLFFVFGVLLMLPAVVFIFGPRVSRGHLVYDPPHPLLTIGSLCFAVGIFAVVIGLLSSRAFQLNNRNA